MYQKSRGGHPKFGERMGKDGKDQNREEKTENREKGPKIRGQRVSWDVMECHMVLWNVPICDGIGEDSVRSSHRNILRDTETS